MPHYIIRLRAKIIYFLLFVLLFQRCLASSFLCGCRIVLCSFIQFPYPHLYCYANYQNQLFVEIMNLHLNLQMVFQLLCDELYMCSNLFASYKKTKRQKTHPYPVTSVKVESIQPENSKKSSRCRTQLRFNNPLLNFECCP